MTREATTQSLSVILRDGLFLDGDWVESKDQDPTGDVRLTQLADIGDTVWRDRSNRWMNDEQARRLRITYLEPGDVLVARMPDPLGRACLVPRTIGRAATVVDVAILRPSRDSVDNRFLMYAINSRPVRDQIDLLQAGATRQRISRRNLGTIRVPFPLLGDQQVIADFLDGETAQIDALVAKQYELVALLRERRARSREVLASRVNDGHRLRWSLVEIDQRAGARANDLPLMSVSIDWGVRRRDEVTAKPARAEELTQYKVCLADDIVVNRMRAFQGALGVAPEDGIVSPDYAVLRAAEGVNSRWLAELMRTKAFVGEMTFRLRGIGGTDSGNVRTPRINTDDLLDIRAEIPRHGVQVSEVNRLAAQTVEADVLIAKAQEHIALAKERRAALITAAVTGQIDVRTAQKAG